VEISESRGSRHVFGGVELLYILKLLRFAAAKPSLRHSSLKTPAEQAQCCSTGFFLLRMPQRGGFEARIPDDPKCLTGSRAGGAFFLPRIGASPDLSLLRMGFYPPRSAFLRGAAQALNPEST
jgi:hypothetical protein